MFKLILFFFIFLILIILFIGFGIIKGIVKIFFGQNRTMNGNDNPNTSFTNKWQQNSNRKKIFNENEGEYVEFEEIDDKKTKEK